MKVREIEVGTVEIFQGREKEVIIMSAVRTKLFHHDNCTHIGFLSNPKRFNVAVTRAKNLLIIVGNPEVLKTDERWAEMMEFCKENQSYTEEPTIQEIGEKQP